MSERRRRTPRGTPRSRRERTPRTPSDTRSSDRKASDKTSSARRSRSRRSTPKPESSSSDSESPQLSAPRRRRQKAPSNTEHGEIGSAAREKMFEKRRSNLKAKYAKKDSLHDELTADVNPNPPDARPRTKLFAEDKKKKEKGKPARIKKPKSDDDSDEEWATITMEESPKASASASASRGKRDSARDTPSRSPSRRKDSARETPSRSPSRRARDTPSRSASRRKESARDTPSRSASRRKESGRDTPSSRRRNRASKGNAAEDSWSDEEPAERSRGRRTPARQPSRQRSSARSSGRDSRRREEAPREDQGGDRGSNADAGGGWGTSGPSANHGTSLSRIVELLNCCEEGDLRTCKKLLRSGIDTNVRDADGYTPLIMAVAHQHQDLVEELLDQRADVNAADNQGATALHVAAQSGFLPIMQMLLDARGDPSVRANLPLTPLFLAAQENHGPAVELLFDYGATDLNSNDHLSGATPLYIASQEAADDAVRALIKCRANVNLENGGLDSEVRTPIYIAMKKGNVSTIELLEEAGARLPARPNPSPKRAPSNRSRTPRTSSGRGRGARASTPASPAASASAPKAPEKKRVIAGMMNIARGMGIWSKCYAVLDKNSSSGSMGGLTIFVISIFDSSDITKKRDQYLISSETLFKISQKRSDAFKLDTDGKKITLQSIVDGDFEKWMIAVKSAINVCQREEHTNY